jgi:hypothetical protein
MVPLTQEERHGPEPWLAKQPLCVAGRPERARLPYAIALAMFGRFKGHGSDYIRWHWSRHCDPPWPAKVLEAQLQEAKAELEKQRQRQADEYRADELEDEYDITATKYYDEEYLDYITQQQWQVEGLIVKLQAAMWAGPIKTLKTLTLIDLMLSCGSGKPFLGHFAVSRPCPVLMFFGENTRAHVARQLVRIAAAKGIDITAVPLHLSYRMPDLADDKALADLSFLVRQRKIGLVIFDPIYLAFPGIGGSATNVFDMGNLYRKAAAACLDSGATPVFSTHSTKELRPGEPMALSDLIFAGAGEFARQWVLFNRRQGYDPARPGEHSIIMSYGGAVGHTGVLTLGVNEGELRPDFGGRKWEATVGPCLLPRGGRPRKQEGEKADKLREYAERVVKAATELGRPGEPVKAKAVKAHAGISGSNYLKAVQLLEEEGRATSETVETRRGKKVYKTTLLRLTTTGTETDSSGRSPCPRTTGTETPSPVTVHGDKMCVPAICPTGTETRGGKTKPRNQITRRRRASDEALTRRGRRCGGDRPPPQGA